MSPFHFFPRNLALDLGTANTLIYVKGRGVVLNEPTIIALSSRDDKVLAVGKRAKDIYGKNPRGIKVIRPMKDGVIADFDAVQLMIRTFLQRVIQPRYFLRPRVIVSVPSGITPVEKRAVFDSVIQTGARKVYLIEEPIAAAIGMNLPIEEPAGNMIVDIGGGTTEAAVITSCGVESWGSIRLAGNEIDEAIQAFFKHKYNLHIGIFDAELVKIEIGCAVALQEEMEMDVKGKNLREGLPKTITVNSEQIREALEGSLHAITEIIRRTLERTAPELARDIHDRGIILCGGGSLLRGLDIYLQRELNLHFHLAKEPLTAVVRGAGQVLEEFSRYRKACLDYRK